MKVFMVLLGTVVALAGIVCLIKPGVAAITIAYVISIALIVGGIAFLINCYVRKKGEKWHVFLGIIMLICGAVLLADGIADVFSVKFLALMTGFVILLAGVGGIFGALKLKKRDKPWALTMAIAVISAAIGVFAVINPFRGYFILNILFSASLIMQGINIIVSGVVMNKEPEKSEIPDISKMTGEKQKFTENGKR